MNVKSLDMQSIASAAGLNTYTDLGYLNGYFNGMPENYIQCRKAGHLLTVREVSNCNNAYFCDDCMLTWKIDSSG